MQQKAVRAQQFDQIETQSLRAFCRFRMGVTNTRQSNFVERLRGRPTIVERDGGWCRRRPGTGVQEKRSAAVPRQLRRTLVASMGKLNAERRRTRAPAEADNARQRPLVFFGMRPRQPWLMRPIGSTAVCSTITSPAPDSDSEPKCWRCQSFAAPSSALAWHIGDAAIRLAGVMPPRLSGSNRKGVLAIRMGQPIAALALAASNPASQSRTTGQLSSRTQSPKLR